MKQGRATNIAADLLDVSSKVQVDDGSEFVVVATDVRIGRAEIDNPVGSLFTKRAFVQLTLDGLQIAPGQRLGDVVKKAATEEIKRSEVASSKYGGGVDGSAGASTTTIPDASSKIHLEASATVEHRREASSTAIVERSFVKARGGNRWEIYEGGAELEGNYVQAANPLCKLEKSAGSNRGAVTIEGIVYRRDLEFKADKRLAMLTNKEKVILAIMAKKLGVNSADVGPAITIASQEFSDE